MLKDGLEVLRDDSLCPVGRYDLEQPLFRLLPVKVVLVPEADQNLFVHFGGSAELWQSLTALLLLYSREKHVCEDLGDFENVRSHWVKFVSTYALSSRLSEDSLNSFVELADLCLINGLALWEVKLWHV